MTTIQKDKYIFSVDIEKTKEYYKTLPLCDCPYCRNYYRQIKDKLPKLDAFLKEFGVNISKPDEIFSIEMDNYIDYINVYYTVCGNIKSMGKHEINLYDHSLLNIAITDDFSPPNEQTEAYFVISVMGIKLPGVLEEPFPTTDDPFPTTKEKISEKLKNYFKKLFNK